MAFHRAKNKQNSNYIGMKMRCYPSDTQKLIIKTNSDVNRFVYNEFVALNQHKFKIKRNIKLLEKNYFATNNYWFRSQINILKDELNVIKKQETVKSIQNRNPWMKNKLIDSLTKYSAKNTYDEAWNLYKKIKQFHIPAFHKKSKYEQRYTTMLVGQNIRFVNKNVIQLPKIGKIRVAGVRRELLKSDIELVKATVHKTNDNKYYISVQLRSKFKFNRKLRSKKHSEVGIDLNIENFYTDSNNNVVANPRFFEKQKNEIASLQREYSRRLRRCKAERRSANQSKNLNRTKLKLTKAHKKIMNQRLNFTQNVTTTLIKNHDLVVCENLSSKNMLRNHALAMRIADVGWRQFLEELQYKAKMYGRTVILVNPKLTTQTCSNCNYVLPKNKRLTLRNREWICPKCKTHHIRDHNAAKNILNKGLKLL